MRRNVGVCPCFSFNLLEKKTGGAITKGRAWIHTGLAHEWHQEQPGGRYNVRSHGVWASACPRGWALRCVPTRATD